MAQPFPYPPCDPAADAHALRQAMKGAGTDEKTLRHIICNRSRDQLQQIAAAFKANHGHDLRSEIKKETSGNFRKLLVKRFDPAIVVKAKALHHAMKGAGTNEARLVDCLAFTPNSEIQPIKNIFHQKSGHDLKHKLSSETSGDFKKAILDLADGGRDESQINPAQIAEDVRTLYKAGEGRVGTDESKFIKILCNHAPWYNVALNQAYGQQHKHNLYDSVSKEFSGAIKILLQALVTSPYDHWADRIYHSLKGAGTDDKTLVFCLTYLERHELQQCAGIIKARHHKDLKDLIKGDLSGDYKEAALTLCGY
jgi:hypothetical protein